MRLALRLLALATFLAGAAANTNHTATKGLGMGKLFTYRATVAPYAPQVSQAVGQLRRQK